MLEYIDLYRKSGTAGTRTQDQSLKRALLYQLSYRPNEPRMIAELRKPARTAIGIGSKTHRLGTVSRAIDWCI
jgi:hypothetical protein